MARHFHHAGHEAITASAFCVDDAKPLGSVRSVALLSREQFDALEFDAASTGDHLAAARRMSQLADTGTATAAMPRSEAYLRAGEQWLLADEPAQAATDLRRAMADGGPVFADPRVPLARALFLLGREAEAQALIGRLKAEGPRDPRDCDLVAELLLERADLAGALGWATAGVELCLGRLQGSPAQPQQLVPQQAGPLSQRRDDEELRLLLSLRYRIRVDLGLPEDRYDELLDSD
jgi:predicted Zn-dependent protease